MKHSYRILVISLATYAPCTAFATNGYQLIGVGAYQKSLGGAVTANPGSAMTAVSNPAGMARIGSRADFSMEAFMPEREAGFSAMGGDTAESAMDLYGVPAIGWTAPVSDDNKDVYFGGGMYGTSGMGVDYSSTLMMPSYPGPDDQPVYWDGYSNISFWQMAPTLAWNQNERLSLGVSLNLDYQSVAFSQRTMQDTNGDGINDTTSNFDLGRSASAFGLGLSFGMMYDLTDSIDIGFAYKSPQEFSDLEYQLSQGDITDDKGNPLPAGTYKLDLDYPQQASAGIAYRATPALTISADVKWIEWSDTMNKLTVEGPGGIAVPMDPGWDDQTVYAIGLAYAVSNRFNIRVGYNHADAPFGSEEVSRNLILPAVVEDHYTIGGDYRLNNHWEVAVHYMYAPEETFTAPEDDPIAPGAEIKLGETSFGLNVGYRF